MTICDHCHDVIGVYEPLVLILDGQPCETSRAADPQALRRAGGRFHRHCYQALAADPDA